MSPVTRRRAPKVASWESMKMELPISMNERLPTYHYDPSSDALVARLRPGGVTQKLEIEDYRDVYLDERGHVVAIRFRWASRGIGIDDVVGKYSLEEFKPFLDDMKAQQFSPIFGLAPWRR